MVQGYRFYKLRGDQKALGNIPGQRINNFMEIDPIGSSVVLETDESKFIFRFSTMDYKGSVVFTPDKVIYTSVSEKYPEGEIKDILDELFGDYTISLSDPYEHIKRDNIKREAADTLEGRLIENLVIARGSFVGRADFVYVGLEGNAYVVHAFNPNNFSRVEEGNYSTPALVENGNESTPITIVQRDIEAEVDDIKARGPIFDWNEPFIPFYMRHREPQVVGVPAFHTEKPTITLPDVSLGPGASYLPGESNILALK
tara:strand:+ start:1851 stop:2621 length:771 start_codon:yes stop_codon:yes gene_type:complete